MIEILKKIRNWLVLDNSINSILWENISIWEPPEPMDNIYCIINTIPTSWVNKVEENQVIEIRIIWTSENDFWELQTLQKNIRNIILNNLNIYWLYNLEIFNNSFWYNEHKRPWSVEFYNIKSIIK